MAKKNTAKNIETPKIDKKWYEFTIDATTLKQIEFSWELASGIKFVHIYDHTSKPESEIYRCSLRSTTLSYYFVLDKANKRIFAYPIRLVGHDTRGGCINAHWEKIDCNSFYMWDENKQMWEVPYKEYRRYCRYDYINRVPVYETISAEPRKISRLPTYYYKMQCQLTSHVKNIFSGLYGNTFVYQNKLVTDTDIRDNLWLWIAWLNTKGRKYSEKTIRATNELMSKFSSESRTCNCTNKDTQSAWQTDITLETINGITAICYWSRGKETFRQIFNNKTCKFDNFIWKNGEWTKSGKLSEYQGVSLITICESYKDTHEYDYMYLKEAEEWHNSRKNERGYWHSPQKNIYEFVLNYISKPVIHQILQISNDTARQHLYKALGNINDVYGNIPNRGKTMYAKLGVNKYQFNNPDVIVYMKWLLNQNNISYIDNQTWDRCTDAFLGKTYGSYDDKSILDFLRNRGEFSIDRWIKIQYLSDLERNNAYGWSSNVVKQLYKDYYQSLLAMSEFGIDISAYPVIFNDKQQLQRYHDDASRAVSAIKNRAADEKFEQLYNYRQKMLENDGKHLIDMPRCSADLTHEGSYLKHCVGGYVNSVANGSTSIYFLRQASAPNTPWLTVEVQNKQCRQIHGSCNAWMGSKDEYFEAVPFLVWWFEKHDIEYNDNLLTNMATGYCRCDSNRKMPTDKINEYKALRKMKKSS